MTAENILSPQQAHALFDILTSHVTLSEIEDLKYARTIATFGPPLETLPEAKTSSPLLRILLKSFILDLPGLRNVTTHFWTDSIRRLITALDAVNLSESYDKGSVGIRRTLSTAVASIVESVSRGCLGGYPKQALKQPASYEKTNPDDVVKAWDDFLQRIIYGDLLDGMFVKASQTDKLADHEPVVQAAHQYALIMLAALLHHNLIVSPRGQSIISLLNRVHRLAPYFLIKQTLRVGNAASMLNGMTQLLLAKMNLSTLTSWFRGQVSDAGMNLLQQIISQVLAIEITEFRKRAKQIEQAQDAPEKPQLDLLRQYPAKSSHEQQRIRTESATRSISIIAAILNQDPSSSTLSDPAHKLALDYLSVELAIRDREQLIQVLCHHSPDLVTTSIRELVSVYDPIIRALHKAVDLGSGVTDLQSFLDDLIALSQIDKAKGTKVPTIQDFVHMLEKHQGSSHRFIHQTLKNGKELSEWYHQYANHAVEQYKQRNESSNQGQSGGAAAGDFTPRLNNLVAALSEDERGTVIIQLDKHATFLAALAQKSKKCMDATVRASLTSDDQKLQNNEANGSPGMFLLKWQQFIDTTVTTPRPGEDEKVKDATPAQAEEKGIPGEERAGRLKPPDVGAVLRLLGPGFREELVRLVDARKGELPQQGGS